MINQDACQLIVGAFGGMGILVFWVWKFVLIIYGYKIIKLLVDNFYKHRKLKYGY